MKTLTIILICLLLFVPCQAAEKRPEQNQWREPSPGGQRFEEIEKYISRRHREIENYYGGQLVELRLRAQSEIRMLEVADKAVYGSLAEQAEVAKVVLHIDDYGYRAPWYLVAETERKLQLKDDFDEHKIKKSPKWFTMTQGSSIAETAEIVDGNSTSGSTSGSTFALSQSWIDYSDLEVEGSIKKTPKLFAVAHSRIAERKNRILEKLEWETLELERQKQYALTTGLAQLEKQLKEDALKPKPEVTHGIVSGILYSSDKPSAIVGRKIVHEGDTINGVKVVKIFRDKVVFEKKGRGWDQKVQEKPGAYW